MTRRTKTIFLAVFGLALALPALSTALPAIPNNVPSIATRQHDHHGEMAHGDEYEDDDESMTDMPPASPSHASSTSTVVEPSPAQPSMSMTPPDPHAHHNSHVPAKVLLDDADIHNWHDFPPSYLAADFRLDNDSAIFGEVFDESWDPEEAGGQKGLMFVHVGMFCVAYFGMLPLALGLRAADHPTYHLVNVAFIITGVLGWLAGAAYRAATPNRYEGSAHGTLGNILLIMSLGFFTLDSFGLVMKAVSLYRQGNLQLPTFARQLLRGSSDSPRWSDENPSSRYEMIGLVDHDERDDEHDEQHNQHQVVFAVGEDESDSEDHPEQQQHRQPGLPPYTGQANKPRRPSLLIRKWTPPSRSSTGSEGTLQDTPPLSGTSGPHPFKHASSRSGAYDQPHAEERHHGGEWTDVHRTTEKRLTTRRFLAIVLTWVRRSQVVLAYVTFLTGFAVYTGMCRATFLPSCLAHYIKGSIFFLYGLLTFGRYLGAYADLGWAWNRRPAGKSGISAEMVECGVIFTYGVTNTWLERIGAHAGDPYSVKQVQHISIAVMFWFAGLSGMLLESRRVRTLLGAVLIRRDPNAVEPASYAFSFNPLPAIVIAVTGLAMAAHHQDYAFQVSIHSLWGLLLAGGSAFRLLTYMFLYLSPPTSSDLPSRPPTEILTSFGWAAGGIVFMLSGEEIAYAAMRAGYDDVMAFLNFTIALTCLVFCWIVVVLAVKGWGVLRVGKAKEGERQEREEGRA